MTEEWIVPTVDDLNDYLAASAMTAFKTAALGAGQTNPFTNIMPAVVARIRNYIASCSSNVLSETANSIPLSLKECACLMIIRAMEGRIGGISLTEYQRKTLEDLKGDLELIAKCELAVTLPPDPEESTSQFGAPAEVISNTPLITKRSQTAGL